MYANKRIVPDGREDLCTSRKRRIEGLDLIGGCEVAQIIDALFQNNVRTVDGIVGFVQSARVIVAEEVDDPITAFIKGLVGREHIVGRVTVGSGGPI